MSPQSFTYAEITVLSVENRLQQYRKFPLVSLEWLRRQRCMLSILSRIQNIALPIYIIFCHGLVLRISTFPFHSTSFFFSLSVLFQNKMTCIMSNEWDSLLWFDKCNSALMWRIGWLYCIFGFTLFSSVVSLALLRWSSELRSLFYVGYSIGGNHSQV